MFKNKYFYAMAIVYIAILAALFSWMYPSASLGSVSNVLALIGVGLAAATFYLLKRLGYIDGGGET